MKIDWKRKLASRKLWVLLVAVTASALNLFGVVGGTQENVIGLVTTVGACVVYMLSEGMVDAVRANKE